MHGLSLHNSAVPAKGTHGGWVPTPGPLPGAPESGSTESCVKATVGSDLSPGRGPGARSPGGTPSKMLLAYPSLGSGAMPGLVMVEDMRTPSLSSWGSHSKGVGHTWPVPETAWDCGQGHEVQR